MAKKRKTHGGKRKGAGRKASPDSRQGMAGFRPNAQEADMLADLVSDHGSISDVLRAGLASMYQAKHGQNNNSKNPS